MSNYDRSAEDVGNVLALEHVNVTVPDQEAAALFYVSGLGFTRDPYIDFGQRNMWINVGSQQFHLPLGEPQVFRGRIHVVVPDLDGLQRRLERVARGLAGTRFDFAAEDGTVAVTCPWGNRIVAHGPEAYPRMTLGIPHLEVDVRAGTAAGIGRFYRDAIGCPAKVEDGRVRVRVGHNQTVEFIESDRPLPAYDRHHVAVYVGEFSRPHRWLIERNLITEESDQYQYRFQSIIDPEGGELLTELEHEVRSMSHPMFLRPLVNRNPAVGLWNYQRGSEEYRLR